MVRQPSCGFKELFQSDENLKILCLDNHNNELMLFAHKMIDLELLHRFSSNKEGN